MVAGAAVGNTVRGARELFTETLTVDFDEFFDRTPDRGMRLGVNLNPETHFVMHVGQLGLGLYSNSSSISRVTVPQSFIELLAKGNELDEDYSGNRELAQRSFTDTGLYGSYSYGDFVVAGKLGVFAPVPTGGRSTGEPSTTSRSAPRGPAMTSASRRRASPSSPTVSSLQLKPRRIRLTPSSRRAISTLADSIPETGRACICRSAYPVSIALRCRWSTSSPPMSWCSAAPELAGVFGRRGLGVTVSLAIGW